RFFVGEQVAECIPFRMTRNADLAMREDSASDMLDEMEQLLLERRLGDSVRLEVAESASPELVEFLAQVLHAPADQIYSIPGPLDLSAFLRIAELPGRDALKVESWPPLPALDIP